ncbi:FAD-dependent monooxygenase [Wenzhouxiangella sp. XN24]|nr:FAD-dependent monooxygenase [Wenzhouxiangella sp. XN24]
MTAMALRNIGIEATVYEARRGQPESPGLFLGLGVNGMRALDELDLLEPVLREQTIPTPRSEFRNAAGQLLGIVCNGSLRDGIPSVTISRGALQESLAVAAQSKGVQFHYGKRLLTYQVASDSVTARFTDGTEACADLLIGADGIHSRVRQIMSPIAPGPSYTGLLNFGGIVRDSGLEPTVDTMRMVWGRRAFFGYTVRDDGEAWWFANIGHKSEPKRDELDEISMASWRQKLVELFSADPAYITHLIRRAPSIWVAPIHDIPSIPRWHRGRAVLVGDSAHAVSPSAGQGASLAIEDALVLAKCLRDLAPTRAALERYEALRKPRAERIVAVGRQRGNYKAPPNRAAAWLRDLMMPIALRLFATEERLAWIHDYRVDWHEPITPAPA